MPRQTIAQAVAEVLSDRRAATSEELGKAVAGAGLTRAASPTRAVSRALGDDPRFHRLADDRWVMAAQLLEGAILTHRPTAMETENGVLALVPDLALLTAMNTFGLQRAEGGALSLVWDAEAVTLTGADTDVALKGSPDWLDHADGRPLLHVRLLDGRIAATWGPEPDAAARMGGRRIVEMLRRALDRAPRSEILGFPPSVSLRDELLAMLVEEPGILGVPLAPLGELFEGTGLEVHRGWVGHAGTDWSSLDEFFSDGDDWDLDGRWDEDGHWHDDGDRDEDDAYDLARLPGAEALGDGSLEDRDDLDDEEAAELSARMAEVFGLGDEQIQGLQVFLGSYELSRRGQVLMDPALLRQVAAIVADPAVARVVAMFARTHAAFEPFVAQLEVVAAGAAAAGPRYVLATLAEARDDVLGAEQALKAALAADAGFRPAAVELARYEVDRGTYGEALRLVRESGAEADDPERAWLEEVGRSRIPKVGRNEPCPCGSGRKYKACHLDREVDAVYVASPRALFHKLDRWLSEPRVRRLIDDLLVEVIPDSARPERDEDERDDLDGPFLDDVVLFDRGELDRFLRIRGVLLPEAERHLGRSWLTTRRSLYEVRAVRPGRGLTLRDLLADGSEVDLPERGLSRNVDRLDLLCLRLVPDGVGGLMPTSAVLVPRSQRGRLIEIMRTADPIALLRWLARPATMPQLANMEGEPLQLIEATYRLTHPATAAAALGRRLRDDGDGRYTETFVRDGRDWIRGSITIEGDVARLEANSSKRADRLERTLMRAAPGARLIRREEQGVEEALERRAEGAAEASADDQPIDPATHPEVAAVLEQMMREYEARWVDESIPALGDMTPREALADPAMRPELDALLDDLTWQARRAGPGATMDPDRIRVLLGL